MATNHSSKRRIETASSFIGSSSYKAPKGLNEAVIRKISKIKREPKWMLDFRLKALKIFNEKPLPTWGPDLSNLDFQNIHYYIQSDSQKDEWGAVDKKVSLTFENLGVRKEEHHLGALSTQYNSEVVYKKMRKELIAKGAIFESTDVALKKYPEHFKEYFGKIVPMSDNKFAALNSAVWSGGSFIYIPKGVKLDLPLHTYFRINEENMGQFERTLIIADEESSLHYIEGCTAPLSSANSLHTAVVEIIAKKGSRIEYTTLQNWAHNVYNLATKRAHVYKNAEVLWTDCNTGSFINMKYPAAYLLGEGAKSEMQSLTIAGENQIQDTGAKIIHAAPHTSSSILSKSISKNGGQASYRGLIRINKGAINAKNRTNCDALIMDEYSRSDTYPTNKIYEDDVSVAHEATISRIDEDQLFYLMSRGLNEQEARSIIVNGFTEPILKNLPMEYALELNQLIELEITESVG